MTGRIVTEYPDYRNRCGCYLGTPGLYNALLFSTSLVYGYADLRI